MKTVQILENQRPLFRSKNVNYTSVKLNGETNNKPVKKKSLRITRDEFDVLESIQNRFYTNFLNGNWEGKNNDMENDFCRM